MGVSEGALRGVSEGALRGVSEGASRGVLEGVGGLYSSFLIVPSSEPVSKHSGLHSSSFISPALASSGAWLSSEHESEKGECDERKLDKVVSVRCVCCD